MIGDRKKKETSFDLVRNWKRGNELNVGRDTKKRKRKEKKKSSTTWPSLERTFAWRRDAGSPTLSSSLCSREFTLQLRDRVTGSELREVTMREDGCRLSDATLDKYLRCAPLPLQRFASRLPNRVSARIFRGSFKGTVPRVVAFSFSLFPFFFTGSSSRDGGNFTRSPLFHDGENAQLQFSMLVRLCVCRYFSWLSGQVISSFPVFFFVSHASRTSSNSNWN